MANMSFIKLEGDRFQDGHTPLAIQGFHHEDVASTSNLKMSLKPILHSFVQLKARKMWPYTMP